MYQQIERLYVEQRETGAAIYRKLRDQFPDRHPSEKTVQNIIREDLTPPDPSGPWSLADPDVGPADAGVVLETLGHLLVESEGKIAFVSRAEARFVALIRRSVSEIEPLNAYGLARRYLRATALPEGENRERALAHLDTFVAMHRVGALSTRNFMAMAPVDRELSRDEVRKRVEQLFTDWTRQEFFVHNRPEE